MTLADGLPADFREPAYGTRTLADVLPAVASALGVEVAAWRGRDNVDALVLPPADRYVVLLVDGLGHQLISRHVEDAPYLASLVGAPGLAGVPSTTATSLTSLGTALTPGQHGLVGFTSRVPGTDRLLNALFWDKQVDPLEWQPNPSGFALLAAAGVDATVVNKREFMASGLTMCGYRGADFIGADRIGERIAGVVEASRTKPSFTYVYDGDLDWTGHRYGVDSPQWRAQLSAIDAEAEQLREALDPGVRLVVVADHGMVDSTEESRFDIDLRPELREGVHLLAGEARFRHLYVHSGAVTDVASTWQEVLGRRADVLTRDQAIARGWFGEVSPMVRPRLGDIVVAARGDFAMFSSVDFPYEMSLVGLHGSLTRDEMEIPILVG